MKNNTIEDGTKNKWVGVILGVIVLLIVGGIVVRELSRSLVDTRARFNLLLITSEGKSIAVVSYDPVEQKNLVLKLPSELEVSSRSVGSYRLDNLYRLGGYKGSGGEFARRKVQGFLRLPIVGYLVDKTGGEQPEFALATHLVRSMQPWREFETNMSYFDRYVLYRLTQGGSLKIEGVDELLRTGALSQEGGKLVVMRERLDDYVKDYFFDWGVGAEGATVAIINESGIDGMGSDMAQFLGSLGLDVVMVRSGEEEREETKYIVEEPTALPKSLKLLLKVLPFGEYEVAVTKEYRSHIVMWVGRDVLELF